ncbi:hypothetical protein CRG98_022779 [Punica granatum]|uniref:Uncharacterized protein n=1 Tax=Punica granatum TaxID=22663 RepID=A0A2I0JKM2_PUNGR|nr:hypothetical protein CRG98_022779 [Punica granatum]
MAELRVTFEHIDVYVEYERKDDDAVDERGYNAYDECDSEEGGSGVHDNDDDGFMNVKWDGRENDAHEQHGEEDDDDPNCHPPNDAYNTDAYSSDNEEYGSEKDNYEFMDGQRNKKKLFKAQIGPSLQTPCTGHVSDDYITSEDEVLTPNITDDERESNRKEGMRFAGPGQLKVAMRNCAS